MKIAIIGAGAAGLMAAASVEREDNTEVIIFEKNDKCGKKIYITGKGRCNFTNECEPEDFLKSVVTNPKFLYSAIYKFSPKDTMFFLATKGCPSRTERGGRVFPVSDKASDVTKALVYAAQENGAKIMLGKCVKKISRIAEGFQLLLSDGEACLFDKVILATGGKSYPSTGSTGDGYAFAASLGHSITAISPSLVSLRLKEDVTSIEGTSLKNVEAEILIGEKKHKEFGEMLFTRYGVSGPIILSLSSFLSRENIAGAKLSINLKPALSREMLDKRILRDFEECSNKQLKNALDKLLPKSLISFIINYTKLDGSKQINLVSRDERAKLVEALSGLSFTVSDRSGFEEAIITSGGINVKEINPSTMESKLVSGLYFAGEIIDVDALTGGFNMQIAFSTGRLAGNAVCR